MSEEKKYFWLRLKRDFFKRHDIQIIEGMPNGKDYILFYLKLLCESVDHEGNLRFSDEIPYNEQMLSTITNTNIDIVRTAIKAFTDLGMMDILDDGTLYMNGVEKLIGSETYWAEAKRKQRAKQTMLEDKNRTLSIQSQACPSKSIEIELDKEKEIDIKEKSNKKEKPVRHKYGQYQNVLLSDDDMEKLKNECPDDWEEWIERVSSYCKSKGKTYSDYLATIRNWKRKDARQQPKTGGWDNVKV